MLKKSYNLPKMNLQNYDYADALDDYLKRIIKKYAPAAIILFGSLARADYWHDSDADIIVILREKKVNHLLKGIELRKVGYDFPLDLFVYGYVQFKNMLDSGNIVALDALEFGKVTYIGNNRFWEALQRKWSKIRAFWLPTDFGWKKIA